MNIDRELYGEIMYRLGLIQAALDSLNDSLDKFSATPD